MIKKLFLCFIATAFYFQVNAVEYLRVGETKTLYFPYEITSKTLAGKPACISTRPYDVEVVSSDYSSVTIKANKSFSGAPCLINVRYYYRELVGTAIYQRTGSYDFRVYVNAIDPQGVTIYPTSVTFKGFTKSGVYATLIPDGAESELTWSSTNTRVAQVYANGESGYIYAESTGECDIIVTTKNGYSAKCHVVVQDTRPTGISLPGSLSLREGEVKKLTPTLSPSDALTGIIWSSQDESIATVSSSGWVTGIKVGSTLITAKTSVGGYTSQCNVTVLPPPVQPTDVILPEKNSLYKGFKQRLTPSLVPENAEATYTWKSSNSNVVSVDASGNISANKVGTASVTVTTHNGVSAACEVTVKDLPEEYNATALKSKMSIIEKLRNVTFNKLY